VVVSRSKRDGAAQHAREQGRLHAEGGGLSAVPPLWAG
jgi:hypothetical protein